MPKPAQLPRWATGVSAKVTPEPTEGKKDLGWVSAEKPPEAYWNWLLNRIYLWCVYLDTITNEALTWAGKAIFNAGLATPIAPTAGDDVANKTFVDGKFPLDATRHGAQTDGTLHAAATGAVAGFMAAADKTKLDNAVSAPTASRLVLRDAAGRAQFVDPSAAGDADTKGARDAAILAAPILSWTLVTVNANWNGAGTLHYTKGLDGIIRLKGFAAALAGAANPAFNLPVGFRPGINRRIPIVENISGTIVYATFSTTGDVSVSGTIVSGNGYDFSGVGFAP